MNCAKPFALACTYLITLQVHATGKKEKEVLTLSGGKYVEVFDRDSIEQIGSVLYHVNSEKIIGFIKPEDSSDVTTVLKPEIMSRWLSTDPLAAKYPSMSPYIFVANNPINAIDPDGRIIVFVNGLMLDHALASNSGPVGQDLPPVVGLPYPTYEQSSEGPTYLGEIFDYWGRGAKNMVERFNDAFHDQKDYFVNGSDHTWSEASTRYKAGLKSGQEMVQKIVSGELKLADDETIKIVGHSQGGAHAAGMAYALQQAYINGMINNKVEQIVYLAPHQPTDFATPPGIPSTQYSRRSDLVSSRGIVSTPLVSGGSRFGPIKGIGKFIVMPNMTGAGNGLNGTRGEHNVDTYSGIFNLITGQRPSTPSRK